MYTYYTYLHKYKYIAAVVATTHCDAAAAGATAAPLHLLQASDATVLPLRLICSWVSP